MRFKFRGMLSLLSCTTLCGFAQSEEIFLYIPLNDVPVIQGEVPTSDTGVWDGMPAPQRRALAEHFQPYVIFDNRESEGWITFGDNQRWMPRRPINPSMAHLAIRTNAEPPIEGRMLLPSDGWEKAAVVGFRIESFPDNAAAARESVLEAKLQHHERLAWINGTGSSWFRYQAAEAWRELGREEAEERDRFRRTTDSQSEIAKSMEMMAGGRAVAENLALDEVLQADAASTETVRLEDVQGVTIPEYDWGDEIESLSPQKDALAELIPADCLAVFLPSFSALKVAVDEGLETELTEWTMSSIRPTDQSVFSWYERQLALPLNEFTSRLGEYMITRMAVCAEDPFFPTGTSIAVLFETESAEGLEAAVLTQYGITSLTAEVSEVEGFVVHSVRNEDRSVCSHVGVAEGHVIVSNSPDLMERILKTAKGEEPSVSDTPEYTFFRDRYSKDDEEETALVVLTDAAIRKWTGPKWRIAASRRTRAAAVMLNLLTAELDAKGSEFATEEKPLDLKQDGFDPGRVRLLKTAIASSIYGTLSFLTPVAELELDEVTKSEADAYSQFRRRYEGRWQGVFDPIALKLDVGKGKLAADLTVRPLMVRSDYRWSMELAGSRRLTENRTSMQENTIGRYVMALDPESRWIGQATGFATSMAPTLGANPLNWVGGWISIETEAHPFWDELKVAAESERNEAVPDFMEDRFTELPLVISIGSTNALKLTAFVTALRGFVEQASPGMTVWEPRQIEEVPYVRIGATERAQRSMTGSDTELTDPAVYYSVMPEAFVLSLNEQAIQAMILRLEKEAEEQAENAKDAEGSHSADGPSMAFAARRAGIEIMALAGRAEMLGKAQSAAWANIHILNALRRDCGVEDAVGFVEQWWGERPVSPGGGSYVWNNELQTWESTDFGSPWSPKSGWSERLTPLSDIEHMDFALTFEENGLRAEGSLMVDKGE